MFDLCENVWERRRFLPRERFSPYSKGPLLIQVLIEGIEKSFIMNVEYVLQKIDPFLFFLLAFIILFELESREECPFKCIKYADRNNQSNDTICLIKGLFIHIIIFMHILEHLNGSRTHRNIHIL